MSRSTIATSAVSNCKNNIEILSEQAFRVVIVAVKILKNHFRMLVVHS